MKRTLSILSALVLLALGGTYLAQKPADSLLATPALAQDADTDADVELLPDLVLGDADAPVTVIEYASYTCPHCREFHEGQFQQLKAEYIDTGKVAFIMREFYRNYVDVEAAQIARCGGDMRFYGISGLVYEKQEDWIGGGENEEILANLRKLGKTVGLTDDQIDACFADQDMAKRMIVTFQKYAGEDGIQGTPTLKIDGKIYSNMSYDKMKEIIDAALAAKEG
ncbi:MAG: DsbA family protein [Maritimibacter sp.]